MFVVTADQVDSRNRPDIVEETRDALDIAYRGQLELPVDRNAGDELQALTRDAGAALGLLLTLDRSGDWSTGIGVGDVRDPLPDSARAATGPAFFSARDAVGTAKKRPTRFALRAGRDDAARRASDAEALIDLLLIARARRSEAGWELYDLLQTGITQRDAAERLGISEPAVSSRARVAGIHPETAAVPALTRLLHDLDAATSTGADA